MMKINKKIMNLIYMKKEMINTKGQKKRCG